MYTSCVLLCACSFSAFNIYSLIYQKEEEEEEEEEEVEEAIHMIKLVFLEKTLLIMTHENLIEMQLAGKKSFILS